MTWITILAIVFGVAINRAVLTPALSRYRVWKDGPRERVARPNWRGVYVPDLRVIRMERAIRIALIAIPILGVLSLLFIIPHHR